MGTLNLAVLISGRGSNLKALLTACADPDFPSRVALVVSDNADAAGLGHADTFGVPRTVIERGAYSDRGAFEAALDAAIRARNVDLICLAGFMRLLSESFVRRWWNRIVNIHPSLLPAFPGLDTHERALASGVRLSGCTVHIVRPAMDDGPILVQAAVPVLPDDTGQTLADRILIAEHEAYPLAVRLLAERRVEIVDERVLFADATLAARFGPESILRVP
ncbi:MAG: phosphoribosylglycinamide formyltransferase [Pseudomonadota bacterium]